MAVFLLGLIYGIITRILAKKRGNSLQGKASILLPVFGLLSGGNAVISVIRIMGAPSTPISSYRIHLIINLLLAIGMALAAIFMARSLPGKKIAKKDKVANILSIVSAVLFILWQINYNLLAFWSI